MRRRTKSGPSESEVAALRRGTVSIVPESELVERLASGRLLRVKLGIDPTTPDVHLGHAVVLSKLRAFQDMGHVAVLIIGDFTALIGDPSGRSATRPPLSPEQIAVNARTYQKQVFKVLDPARCEVHRNAEWLGRLGLEDVVRLAARATVARLLERDDFQQRHRSGTPIGLHEFLYPLMQGYDSVEVRADVELGGTDQTFNLLMGRDMQRHAGQPGQIAVSMPLLEGTDGVQKMSKSLGNHIGLTDDPEEMYGKLMSVSDTLMIRYYDLLSRCSDEQRRALQAGTVHPMEAKKALALELVSRFHDEEAAARAADFFAERFQHRRAHRPTPFEIAADGDELWICRLIKDIGFAPSTSEARRLVAQGAVRVDGEPVDVSFQFRRGVHRRVEVGRRRLAEVTFRAGRGDRGEGATSPARRRPKGMPS